MKLGRFIIAFAVALLFFASWMAWDYYTRFFKPVVHLDHSSQVFFIQSDWDFNKVCGALVTDGIIQDTSKFSWVARYKKYHNNVKPGRFIILDGANSNQLVNILRSTNEPVDIVIRSVREQSDLVGAVSDQLEADSAELADLLDDSGFCQRYGFTPQTILAMFIPNTYEFYWNTSAEEFITRMALEYKRFWTADRKSKASELGLSQTEVTILASIVQSEQAAHPEERATVAGLYLNRLRKGMRLESDPTLIKAIGDYSIKRVLKIHKEVESPFNTYKYAGLPPAPILLPETTSIDAVLNAQSHNYLYMCAKDDFSGYHNFASSYRTHINNAKKYQRALNERKIYR